MSIVNPSWNVNVTELDAAELEADVTHATAQDGIVEIDDEDIVYSFYQSMMKVSSKLMMRTSSFLLE